MVAAVYSLPDCCGYRKDRRRVTVNRLLQHSAIVLFALCLAVVCPLVPVPAAAEQPDAAQRHYERGAALLRKGDLAAAAEAARKSIELNPSSAEAHHLLGVIYFSGCRCLHPRAQAEAGLSRCLERSGRCLSD
jgi:Tfp pilus assembly protein PilF